MKQYIQNESGSFFDGLKVIPDDPNNSDYIRMQEEITAGDSEIVVVDTSLTLDEKKAKRKAEVDKKTEELIEAGFNHNSQHFKVTIYKQLTAIALHLQRLGGGDMTGKKFRGDGRGYTFADNPDWDAFFSLGFGKIETILNAGSDLKDAMDDAVDSTALDAIVDDRT